MARTPDGYPYPYNPYVIGQVPAARPVAPRPEPVSEETIYMIQIALTAGAGISVTTMPAEPVGGFPFRWQQLGANWNISGAVPPDGLWSIRINDTATQRFFSPGFINVGALLGSVEREPYKLENPFIFPANSAIMIEAINNGAGGDTLTLVFIGKRIGRGA